MCDINRKGRGREGHQNKRKKKRKELTKRKRKRERGREREGLESHGLVVVDGVIVVDVVFLSLCLV